MLDLLRHLYWGVHGAIFGAQSTLSIFALMMTGAMAVLFVRAACRRRRHIPFRVYRRVLLPRRIWRTTSGRCDMAWAAFNCVLFPLFFGLFCLSTRTVTTAWAGIDPPVIFAAPPWLALPIASVVMFLAYEFSFWFSHMLRHHVPLLWIFHKVHHAPRALTPFTGFRVHPVDVLLTYYTIALISGVCGAMLMVLLGPAATLIAQGDFNLPIYLATVLVVHLQHSHFNVDYGPRLGRVLLGPRHHQIHHSRIAADYNSNFGNVLTLFDRLYGSFRMPQRQEAPRSLGIGDPAAATQGFFASMAAPFVELGVEIRAGIRRIGLHSID